jgi:hypothetical protein
MTARQAHRPHLSGMHDSKAGTPPPPVWHARQDGKDEVALQAASHRLAQARGAAVGQACGRQWRRGHRRGMGLGSPSGRLRALWGQKLGRGLGSPSGRLRALWGQKLGMHRTGCARSSGPPFPPTCTLSPQVGDQLQILLPVQPLGRLICGASGREVGLAMPEGNLGRAEHA